MRPARDELWDGVCDEHESDSVPTAAAVAHDIRTPLSVVLGALDELRLDGLSASDREAIVDVAVRSARQALEMVEHLVHSSRSSSHSGIRSIQQVELSELVGSVVSALRHRADARGLRWVVGTRGGPAHVNGEHRALMRLVANLLGNAIRHARGLVRVTVVRDGDFAQLVVEDDGDGIGDELQGRLFRPWQTGRGSDGTGLGLAIVHRLTQAHGGTVQAGNRTEGGARFVVRLPVVLPVTP